MNGQAYLDLHGDDAARDNAIADAMMDCRACGHSFLPHDADEAEDGCCPECADEVARLEDGKI